MGLDMYFTARRSFWDYEDEGVTASRLQAFFDELPDDIETSGTSVSVPFGYWRKANAIHNWFVQNVQGGKDDCQESWVSRESMQSLLDTLNKVLNDRNLAHELLPTQKGFFFGGNKYDEWYWLSIEYTKQMLGKALDPSMEKWDFYYHASW